MGLFSRARRLADAAPAESAAADTSAPAPALAPVASAAPSHVLGLRAPANVSSLRDGLQHLYSIRPSRAAFAEETVKLIAKGTGVKAVALLGYEPRGNRLHLLAHAGLDAEAVQTLSGDNAVNGWDIPLRSLRNRRINVIESAHENPFVPRALIAISPRRLTIAALPFFHANAPIGVAVLFSPTPRGFADGLLKALSQSLRVCALALSELPAGSAVAAPADDRAGSTQPSLLRGLAALKAELARLTDALEEAERQRAAEAAERVTAQSFLKAAQERSAHLEQELTDLHTAGERLPEVEAQVQHLSGLLTEATDAVAAAQSEIVRLRTAVEETDQRAAREAATAAELTARRCDLERQLHDALDAARQRDGEATALRAQIAALAPQAAEAETLRTTLTTTADAKAAADRLAEQVAAELRDAQEARARTEAALAQTSDALAARTSECSARERELEAARAALGAGGQELAATAERAAARINGLDAERTRLAAELEQATAALAQQAASLHTLEHDLDSHRRTRADVEVERNGLAERLAALAHELESMRAAGNRAAAQLAEQSETGARLTAERSDLLARIDALAAGGQSLEQERNTAVSAAQQRVRELEAEIGRLTAALDTSRSQAAEEIARTRGDATSALDALRLDFADAVRARDELQRALGAAQQECAAHQLARTGSESQRADLASAAQRWQAERRELSARIDTIEAERAALQRTHEEALAAAAASYQAEVASLRERAAADTQEQERLVHALAETQQLLQSAEENLTATIDLSTEADDQDSVLDIDRDYAPEGAASTALDAAAEADTDGVPAAGECVMFDDEEIGAAAARRLAEFGHRVIPLAPTPSASDALHERSVMCAAVNLATPNAGALLRHLRNGSGIPHMPLIAYALAADAAKGFWLGPVDVTFLPVAQVDLVALLNRLVHKVKRVIAMSNDIDVMSDVRTQLTGAGISTAVVLDGRQALDLVPTIRPEAAVLHLSPTCADAFRAIAGLRNAEISRDIPIVFLLDAEPQPREEAFLTAGLRMLTGRGSLAADGLVDSLAAAFDGYRPV